MSIITNSPRKVKVLITMLLILAASIWFALHSQPVAMRRESDRAIPVQGVIVLSLDQALNLSLAMGDGRRVDWGRVA